MSLQNSRVNSSPLRSRQTRIPSPADTPAKALPRADPRRPTPKPDSLCVKHRQYPQRAPDGGHYRHAGLCCQLPSSLDRTGGRNSWYAPEGLVSRPAHRSSAREPARATGRPRDLLSVAPDAQPTGPVAALALTSAPRLRCCALRRSTRAIDRVTVPPTQASTRGAQLSGDRGASGRHPSPSPRPRRRPARERRSAHR